MRNSDIIRYPENLEINFISKKVILTKEEKKIIDDNWNKKIIENKNLYNGSVLTLNKDINHKLNTLEFYISNYAHYLASEQMLLPPQSRTHSFYVSALIKTKDNYIAFGEMGNYSFEPGRLQFIGGGLEKKYIKESKIDIHTCIKDEIYEELGLDFDNENILVNLNPLYLSFGKMQNKISIVFYLSIDIDSDELSKKLKLHNQKSIDKNSDREVERLVYVNKETYIEFFNKNSNKIIDENLFSSIDSYFTGKVDKNND